MRIEVSEVGFSYQQPVLQEVSLQIEDGSFFALIGPNGSGKSTLVKIISGLLTPDSGEVWLDGRKAAEYSARALSRSLTVIPSEHYFDFPFLVRDVVSMGRFPHLGPLQGLRPSDREIVSQALQETQTAQLAERSISELSSGERQRVLIARALAQQSGTLILDEPNVHLDINHQIAIFRLLFQLQQEAGKTIIVVLHDLTMVGAFCERVALLNEGRIIRTGTPNEIITEETIRSTYGADVQVMSGPEGNPVLSYSARSHE